MTVGGACLALLLVAAALWWTIQHRNSSSADAPDKSQQIKLIQGLLEKKLPIFLSPEYLSAAHGKLQGLSAIVPDKKASETALRDPSFFHALHREKHFSAVLLAPAQASSPLCLALLSSPLWTLSEVFPSGYLFKLVGSTPWTSPDEGVILRLHPDPSDRAQWLIGTAANLIAIKRTKEADQMLLYAANTKRLPSPLLATQASLAASRGHWNEALILSKQSLVANSSNTAARIILIRSLIECGKPDEALSEAKKLRSITFARNAETLFLLARAANSANDKGEEIKALRDLISLAREQNQPLGASLTYLGQAYAKNGERGEALRTFQKAMDAPELSDSQRKMIKELMDHIALEKR
jgi:tetratricopeptide (TPR) repeat protein